VNAISKEELEADNLRIIRYQTALALMENLFKKGGISEESYERSKRLIAFRHNIKVNSIYR
jgi:uncharacterized membrane protein